MSHKKISLDNERLLHFLGGGKQLGLMSRPAKLIITKVKSDTPLIALQHCKKTQCCAYC